MVRLAIVIGALLFTLIVVAIGLSLSAAESRDERDVLASIGAKPSAMRRVAGLKAAWLALAGGLLAIPTGYLPLWAGVAATTSNRDVDVGTPFPWWIALGVVIAIPIVAGLGAWLASFVAQTVRPVRMSTLSAD
jgi:ABC-type antimicrobial peptide transport system permease subunit